MDNINRSWFPIAADPAMDSLERYGVVPFHIGAEAMRKMMWLRSTPVSVSEIVDVMVAKGIPYWEMDRLMPGQWRQHFTGGWAHYELAVANAKEYRKMLRVLDTVDA